MIKLKSFLKKLFLAGEVLERVCSPSNGEITVVENLFGEREMRVGGVTQSGGLVEGLWKIGIKAINDKQLAISNCLILGLGCGDGARLINETWTEAKIIGVEIDPIVVEIGKKYFGLGEIMNLEIVIGDAVKVISDKKYVISKEFDLIVVDLYLGQEAPKESETNDFLGSLGNMLADGGMVIFNRLYYNKGHQEKADKFLTRVKKFFPEVKTKKVVTNLLLFASN